MRLALFFTFFLILAAPSVFAQKVLQLEKYGKAKTKKYYIGEELTFQLKGERHWHTETIQDILVDENSVLFSYRIVKVDQIRKIRSYRQWARGLSTKLFIFSGSFVALSLITDLVTSWSLTTVSWMLPTIGVATGLLVRFLFKSKTYKLGKKRKLRVLDLNVIPHQGP